MMEEGGLPVVPAAMGDADSPIDIDLGQGSAQAEIFTCDLSYEYVRINAEYTT